MNDKPCFDTDLCTHNKQHLVKSNKVNDSKQPNQIKVSKMQNRIKSDSITKHALHKTPKPQWNDSTNGQRAATLWQMETNIQRGKVIKFTTKQHKSISLKQQDNISMSRTKNSKI